MFFFDNLWTKTFGCLPVNWHQRGRIITFELYQNGESQLRHAELKRCFCKLRVGGSVLLSIPVYLNWRLVKWGIVRNTYTFWVSRQIKEWNHWVPFYQYQTHCQEISLITAFSLQVNVDCQPVWTHNHSSEGKTMALSRVRFWLFEPISMQSHRFYWETRAKHRQKGTD